MNRLQQLRAAAAANLSRVFSGEVRRERAAEHERARLQKQSRKDRIAGIRTEIKELKRTIREEQREHDALQEDYQWLYDKHNSDERLTQFERGMLEEVDYRIDTLAESITKNYNELYLLKNELRL
jgi:chromosome segregation ATPase